MTIEQCYDEWSQTPEWKRLAKNCKRSVQRALLKEHGDLDINELSEERLDDLEATQDPEAIKNAVDDYLANNPIRVEETDPTVPAWAKQPTKPSYTAAEVGALSQSQLQSGINTALAQAKASGEFDGQDGQDGKDGQDGQDGQDGKPGQDGKDGDEEITMEAIAEAADSFNYEFVCGISRRVPRIYCRNGETVHSVHYLTDN